MVVNTIFYFTSWDKKEKNVKFGNDPGSPNEPNVKKKFLITTIISLILTLIIIFIKNEVL